MNLNELKQKLQPQLHEFTIQNFKIFIHRPSGRDFAKCDTVTSTLVLCVKDENGDPIFADEDIEGRINVNSIDYKYQSEIYGAIVNLVTADKVDEIEKK